MSQFSLEIRTVVCVCVCVCMCVFAGVLRECLDSCIRFTSSYFLERSFKAAASTSQVEIRLSQPATDLVL